MENNRKIKEIDNRKAFLIKRYNKRKTLNVGSGTLHIENAINFDIHHYSNINVIGDFHYLPFKENKFNTVFAFDILEHTDHPEVLVSELERVGQNVIIECLDFDICPENWRDDKTHRTYFNKEIFNRLLSPKGYKCLTFRKKRLVAIKNPGLLDKQLCFLYCLFKRGIKEIKRFIIRKEYFKANES